MNVQPFLIGDGWIEVRDGNDTARAIFERHYTAMKSLARRRRRGTKLFIGPGFKLLLLSSDALSLCGWRKERRRRDGQIGVECCVFRREGGALASAQLSGAMELAWRRFPGERLFTFVDARLVRPTMVKGPRARLYAVWGYCFYQAGWRFAGITKKGLHILECRPEWVAA
ncbi:MAG: hypothetical protein J0H53_05370 [Rhizobiales bacterium]|nr:hypothetical protein [Hyphomicrobiales bacterium]